LPKANVFYFDRTSRGAITLAENARKDGAIVVFEPSSESDPALLADALRTAHIVKVASDRMRGNEALRDATTPVLLIETLGAEGLRYSRGHTKKREWKLLPAFKVADFRDAAGAGDWCTAGIICRLGLLGPKGLDLAGEDELQAALKFGQAMAAWACHFDGARGGMYSCSKKVFQQTIEDILGGKSKPNSKSQSARRQSASTEMEWCNCCAASHA
jgi:fructokinase